MNTSKLRIYEKPNLKYPKLLLSFSGWMDGGNVSTGTVNYLAEKLNAKTFAEIDSTGFYILNFPGSMELSSIFRPYVKIEQGLIKEYEPVRNDFLVDESSGLILFKGKEPNIAWEEYADCIFGLCEELEVVQILFIGSVAGIAPHTREPRIFCSVSRSGDKAALEKAGLKFTDYEGPSSIVTYLTIRARDIGISMVSLVAEIPAYLQGYNPRGVEAAVRVICGVCGLHIHFDELRQLGEDFEKRVSEVVQEHPELEDKIGELEADYDKEFFDLDMTDLKDWLVQRGIRLD